MHRRRSRGQNRSCAVAHADAYANAILPTLRHRLAMTPLFIPAPLRTRRAAYLLAAVAIALLPLLLTGSYWRTNLIVCALNVMLAIGLDFVLGYAGQLNLGQSAFYGIGGYASTLLVMRLGVPFWLAFVAAVALSGIAGAALSVFATRL